MTTTQDRVHDQERVVVVHAQLREVGARTGLSPELVEQLWQDLRRTGERPSRARDVAWWGGAAVSLAACAIFLGTGWQQVGPEFGLAVVAVYGVAALLAAEVLRARALPTPSGLMALFAVALLPVAVVAVEDLTGAWRDSDFAGPGFGDWLARPTLTIELLVLVLGLLAHRRYRLPVLLVPPLAAAWALLYELGGALEATAVVGTVATAGLLGLGLWLDAEHRRTEAFWAHLGALVSVLPLLFEEWPLSEDGRALVSGLGGLALLALGVRLERRVHLVFGALGVFGALSYLAFSVFSGSLLFPVALAALGIGVVVAGVRLDAHSRSAAG